MTSIAAEITPDREHLVLVAGGLGAPEDVALAAKLLQALTPLFSKTDPPGALQVPLTWSAIVQLANTYGSSWWPGPRLTTWIADQVRQRTAALPDRLAYTPPVGLVPRPYQIEGALEIARTGRCLVFDEPRTGKTITTILGLVEWASIRHADGPALVVCPASVIDPWVEAWQAWAPHLRAVAWRGPKRQQLAGTADVYVTSYDTARIDTPVIAKKSPLLDLGATALVIDESHYIKNHQAARTKSVQRLARDVEAFVALSGTPITHHPADLWPALTGLAPGAFPSRERWVGRYCLLDMMAEHGEGILGLHPATEPEFRTSLLGQHRRVARADVMSQLPPKVYSTRTVDLPREWRKVYDDFETQMLAELPDGQELSVMSVLTQLTHLSALATAAADVEVTYGPDVDEQTGEPKRHVHLELKSPSWKVDALLEILEERCQDVGPDGQIEKVVVFAPSAQLIKLAGAAAEKAGYRVGYVVGGQSAGARTQAIRDFQTGDLQVILATTSAGGTGITLSAAGTLVFLQRPWSLVESLQAEDRAEGDMNASRGTEVIDVLARNTLDTRVRAVLRERAGQLADLVGDPRIVTELLGGSRHSNPDTERKAS